MTDRQLSRAQWKYDRMSDDFPDDPETECEDCGYDVTNFNTCPNCGKDCEFKQEDY